MATRHACPGLRRAINWSSGKIVHPAHFTAAQFRTEGPYCWILSHLLVSNIEEVIRTLLEWRKIHGTIRIAEVEWKCSNIRNQTPSYDINVQIYLSDTRYNTSGLIRVLVSRSHSNCSLGYMPAVVRPTHTRHCICTDVQPTLLYLYRCSIYTSLSVQVFNLHFSICTRVQPTLICTRVQTYTSLSVHVFNLHFSIRTRVQPTLLYLYTCSTHISLSVHVFNPHFSICTHGQPTLLYLYTCSTRTYLSVHVFNLHFSTCTRVQTTLLYLYTCSTYTSLSVQVFNLHFCICTHVQPTLLYLYTCSTHTSPYGSFNLFHTQVRKPKGIRQPGTINIAISRGPEHRLHCLLNLVGLTACI